MEMQSSSDVAAMANNGGSTDGVASFVSGVKEFLALLDHLDMASRSLEAEDRRLVRKVLFDMNAMLTDEEKRRLEGVELLSESERENQWFKFGFYDFFKGMLSKGACYQDKVNGATGKPFLCIL
jgi:hypothetical protein